VNLVVLALARLVREAIEAEEVPDADHPVESPDDDQRGAPSEPLDAGDAAA